MYKSDTGKGARLTSRGWRGKIIEYADRLFASREVSAMEWNEMPTTRKILFVIGCICGITYIVLSFPALRSYLSIPAAPLELLLGIFWLCMGITTKSKILAIMYYIFAGMRIFPSLFYFFLG